MAALVQASHGMRDWPLKAETGSIIVVIATDAPLAPHQLQRVARRGSIGIGIGIGRGGAVGGNNSGDLFLTFSTANQRPMPGDGPSHQRLGMISDERLDPVYEAAIQSVEEAVIKAMVGARDMGGSAGWDPVRVRAINHDALRRAMTAVVT